jgi:hypothetical protein
MSLEVECGWTLLRALAVALVATPLAALIVATIKAATPPRRRWMILALAVPFLTPGFVVGYSYSNLTLDLVRTPLLNELFYDLLLLIEVVPVGVLVLGMAPPPPLGPTARWCTRLTANQQLEHVASCRPLRQLGYGPARNLIPAFGLMALLVFHEFEIASLFRVIAGGRLTPPSWSNALFELIALQQLGQSSPWNLWAYGWLPLGCSLVLLTPVLLLAWTAISRDGPMPPAPGARRSAAASRAACLWLSTALLLGTIIPLGSLVQDGVPRLSSLGGDNQHQLGRTLVHAGRSLLPALLIASISAGLALWLIKSKRLGLLLLLAVPGLMGGLALGLVLTFCVLALAEPLGLGQSVAGLVLGQALWLLPRAALLLVLLAVVPRRESMHLARLLQQAPAGPQRTAGWQLVWQLAGRRMAWMMGLLCWWAYLELTLNELLAPPQWLSVAHRMYQQMHFGRNAALSSTTLVVVVVPLAVTALLVTVSRMMPGPASLAPAPAPASHTENA